MNRQGGSPMSDEGWFRRWLLAVWQPLRLLATDVTSLLLFVAAPLAMVVLIGAALATMWGTGAEEAEPLTQRVIFLLPSAVMQTAESGGLASGDGQVGAPAAQTGGQVARTGGQVAQTGAQGLAAANLTALMYERLAAMEEPDAAAPLRLIPERRVASAAAREQALDDLRRGAADAVVILPADLARQEVELLADPSRIGAQVLAGVVAEMRQQLLAAGARGPAPGATAGTAEDEQQEQQNETYMYHGLPALPAMDYYALGFAVLFLLFAANAAAGFWLSERRQGIYARMRGAGLSRSSIFLARFAGATLVGFVFLLVQMVGTRLLFGVEWGAPGVVLVLGISGAVMAAGYSTLLMALSPSDVIMDSVGAMVNTSIGFLGGSMFPVYGFSTSLDKISGWIPTRWLFDAFSAAANGRGLPYVSNQIGGLWATAAGLLLVAMLVDRFMARRAGEV